MDEAQAPRGTDAMTMKLVFQQGNRAPVALPDGAYRIGSAANSEILLEDEGVQPLHGELQSAGGRVQLHVPKGVRVRVNDRPVDGLIALRRDDLLELGGVRARLVSEAPVETARDDLLATVVRPVLPRFVLRGLAGELYGRSVPLQGSLVVGRGDDAGLRVPSANVSRQHARLTPAGDEVLVEDLGSANGTWLNGKRITRANARHGDELRFDTQRFQLLEPGRPQRAEAGAAKPPGRWPLLAGLFAAALLATVAWMLL